MTAVITGERGETKLTRFGLEEYVADCVILLDHRIEHQTSTRRLRVVKYRGSSHGTNEYPFLIGERGLSVLPITSLRLDHAATTRRISTGIAPLDQMLGGKGFFRGSSILLSGAAGTGKSSIAVFFADAACRRGERAMIFCYEESPDQLQRNMRSIGIDLKPWQQQGLLRISATRPTMQGLEQHLLQMQEQVIEFEPSLVVVDPITNLSFTDDDVALKPALMRLIDFLKHRNITAMFTNLNKDASASASFTQMGVSSLMDSWILMSNLENNGERTRTLQVIKSRGMAHSNQIREFLMSGHGVDVVDIFVEGDRVLTGTARIMHQRQAMAAKPTRPVSPAAASTRGGGRRSSSAAQRARKESA
jgi:circadian clock protein KaiC